MNTRTALLAAIGCGAAAVLLVGVDLAFNVEGTLEVRGADGSWTVVSQTTPESPYPSHPRIWTSGCGSHFRLTVHNGMPWETTLRVHVTAIGQATTHVVLDEEWSIPGGGERSAEFDVPASTFDPVPGSGTRGKVHGNVEVILDDDYAKQMYAQACAEGTGAA